MRRPTFEASRPADEVVEGEVTDALDRVGIVDILEPVDDRVLDRSDALDLAADAVARLEVDGRVAEDPDARRRPGGDDVARLEGHRSADELDQLGHAPDHVGGVGVLHQDLAAGLRAAAGYAP